MGFLSVFLLQQFALVIEYRAAVLIGFLGAYTTFSSFAIETLYLFEEGNALKAALNIFLSVALCMLAVWFGVIFGRQLFLAPASSFLNSIPYLKILFGLGIVFLLGIVSEVGQQMLDFQAQSRIVVQFLLLAILTSLIGIWMVKTLFNFELRFHEYLGVLLFSNMLSFAILGAGSILGKWLWQLNLFR
jgi:fluoride exporter